MIRQILVAGGATCVTVVLHSLFMSTVIALSRQQAARKDPGPLFLPRVMVVTVLALMLVHVIEVAFWALVYWLVGAAPPGSDLLYFAFVNYATLGYGDITPVPEWRWLGPLTAMNGILLFGWSTAVIFEVLRRTLLRMEEIPG
jgi:hypothetical protein